MIIPTKHLDLDHCVLRVAAQVLTHLAEPGMLELTELQERVLADLGHDAKYSMLPALNVLYLMGRIDYDDGTDVVLLQNVDGERA